ncbi:hypothetical protein LTR36_005166 [Oleoguttula mirabilis]|uniref:Uncharacterized protein n=1 Tax=Oleoguttula mirabilis TaxID=1507867 RepID=A0AAV9JZ06_9PEZI|nr:hypothetical protein LTR36_005166 [Oleoguttula mirabilis]
MESTSTQTPSAETPLSSVAEARTSLLDIPPELRLEIYDHLFAITLLASFSAVADLPAQDQQDTLPPPPILHVCRITRRESMPMCIASLETARDAVLSNAEAMREAVGRACQQSREVFAQERWEAFDTDRVASTMDQMVVRLGGAPRAVRGAWYGGWNIGRKQEKRHHQLRFWRGIDDVAREEARQASAAKEAIAAKKATAAVDC